MPLHGRRGFTLIELLIVVALIGILAALSAPFLVAAKSSANEASAIASLKALNAGQATFATVCGSGGYTVSLPTLVSERFASPDIDVSPKSGFAFALAAGHEAQPGAPDCTGAIAMSSYYFSAQPLGPGTGRRAFATSQVGTVWQDTAGVPPLEPFAPGGTTAPLDTN